MKPLIKKDKYIEIIGHYDNPVLCAKLTLLADMYAIEHRYGYAKFDLKDEGKLSFVNDSLEFVPVDACMYFCGLGLGETIYLLNPNNISIGDIGKLSVNDSINSLVTGTYKLSSSNTDYVPITNYRITSVTGGSGVIDDTSFRAYLDGTIVINVEPVSNSNDYTLTHSLTNLTKGNITIQITPDTNYTYPTTLSVTNGTLVSYDNTTGIAVISGDDTTSVSGECEEAQTLISFTIDGISYQAEDGMTWSQWCSSAYNTVGWNVASGINIIYNSAGTGYVENSDFTATMASSIIQANGEYMVGGGSND